ncbi:hypothetical protein FXO21_10020 [Dyadobacter sp. UC 10]|nr:hypothetical protein FXO21_10020 [Dyadobacter sp. UC 10]
MVLYDHFIYYSFLDAGFTVDVIINNPSEASDMDVDSVWKWYTVVFYGVGNGNMQRDSKMADS